MLDLVIDCESLSLAPNAAIWQIGAVCGDQTFKCTINPSPLLSDVRFDVSQSTIDWQLVNNYENYSDALTINPTYAAEYLIDSLIQWVNQLHPKPTAVWSRHPIDSFWLDNLAKVTGRKLPWKYYQCFDIATLAHVAGERLGKPPANSHDALVDAMFDYENLKRLKEKLNGNSG